MPQLCKDACHVNWQTLPGRRLWISHRMQGSHAEKLAEAWVATSAGWGVPGHRLAARAVACTSCLEPSLHLNEMPFFPTAQMILLYPSTGSRRANQGSESADLWSPGACRA